MLRLNNRIKIYEGNSDILKFDISLLSDVEIKSDRAEYTDTAKISFPNRLRDRSGAVERMNIGDKVEIFLGYFPELKREFVGFINFVGRDSPLQIECEDHSFLLKRISLPATNLLKTTIKEVIERFYTGPTEILDAELGDVRISENATLIKVLDLFRSKYGILSWFRDGVLYINTSLTQDNTERVFLVHEQKNVPLGNSNLKFQKNSDIPVVSHGVSVQRDGTKLELFATYRDNVLNNDIVISELKPLGTLNTLKVPNLSRSALEKLISNRLPLLFYTGVTGEVGTFGSPSLRHGDTVYYLDDRIPAKNGYYRVNSVTKKFSTSDGYKQTLTLGVKVRI